MSISVEVSDLQNKIGGINFVTNTVHVYGIDLEQTKMDNVKGMVMTNIDKIVCYDNNYSKLFFSDEICKKMKICSSYYQGPESHTATTLIGLLNQQLKDDRWGKQNFKIIYYDPIVCLQVEGTKIVYCFPWDITLKNVVETMAKDVATSLKVVYNETIIDINALLKDIFGCNMRIHVIKFEETQPKPTVVPPKNGEQSKSTEEKAKKPRQAKSKKNKIPATLRNAVWNTYIGKQTKEGTCLCCNSESITFANFECGHIVAESKEGKETIQNLRPICSLCNRSMGAKQMDIFMESCGFAKNANWDGKTCDVGPILETSLFFEGLNAKQLHQLCMMFGIYTGGTKQKLIRKLQKKQITKCKIDSDVDKTKRYFVLCAGIDTCENCTLNGENIENCDDCIKNQNEHVYFTDIVLSNEDVINGHRKVRDNKTKCLQCGKISYMEQYDNAFFVA